MAEVLPFSATAERLAFVRLPLEVLIVHNRPIANLGADMRPLCHMSESPKGPPTWVCGA